MAVVGQVLEASLNADASGWVKSFREAETSVEKFLQVAEATGRGLQKLTTVYDAFTEKLRKTGKQITLAGAGVGLSLGVATHSASSFQKEMLNVQSILQGTKGELDAIANTILDLSRSTPQSAAVLAEGMYDIASSGFAAAEGVEVLQAAAISAAAGMTTTAVAAKSITAIINAYGLSASDAADVSDILFQTVNLGVLTFEELSATVGEWVGIAAAAGIAADEAAAGIAAMTLSGINSAEAATALSRLIEAFINPSEKLLEVTRELGHSSSLSMLQTLGLAGAVTALSRATEGSVEQMSELFPNVRALKGVFALAANDGQNFADVNAAITDELGRSGAAMNAFNVQQSGLSAQFQVLQNNMAAFGIELGQVFIPTFTMALKVINKVFDAFNAIPGPIQDLIGILAGVTAAVLILGGIFTIFFLKALLWQLAFRKISAGLLWASGAMAGTSRAALLTAGSIKTLGNAAAVAAVQTGPLATTLRTASIAMVGVNKVAGTTAARFLSVGLAAVLVGSVLFSMRRSSISAKKALEETGQALRDSFDTSSIDSAVTSLKSLESQVQDILDQSKPGVVDAWKLVLTGQTLPNPFADDNVTGRNPLQEQVDQQNAAIEAYNESNTNLEKAFAFTALAMAESRNKIDGILAGASFAGDQPGFFDVMALGAYREALKTVTDEEIRLIAFAAEAAGVDFTPILDDTATADDVEELTNEIVDYIDIAESADPATTAMANAFAELNDETLDITGSIDKLGSVFNAFIGNALGLEAATDAIIGDLQDIADTIAELEDDDKLADAMDFSSMSQGATDLRGDMRGLTDDILAQTEEWARGQDNLTGSDIRDFLEAQIRDFNNVGREMGLTQPFLDHYVGVIREIAENPDIITAFNSNVDTQTSKVDGYLASLGLADTQIETAVEFIDDEAFEDLQRFIEGLDLADGFEVDTIMKLDSEDALDKLENFRLKHELASEDIIALVDTTIRDPEMLPALLEDLGITASTWNAVIEITGLDKTRIQLAVIEGEFQELVEEEWAPAIILDTIQFDTEYDEVIAKLEAIDRYQVSITMGIAGFLAMLNGGTPEAQAINKGLSDDQAMVNAFKNADGGHYPQIFRGQTRIFNEPETGGEAYIPLSRAKRGMAIPVLMKVMEEFGIARFAHGGTTRRGGVIEEDYSRNQFSTGFRGFTPTPTKSGGGGGAADTDTRVRDRLSELNRMLELSRITTAQHRVELIKLLFTTDAYGEEFFQVWKDIKSIDDDAIQAKEDAVREQDRLTSLMFDVGELDAGAYIKFLSDRLANTEKFSEEWSSIWSELTRAQADQVAEEGRIEALRLEVGETTKSEYLKILRDRLVGLDKWSSEWAETWREVRAIEEDVLGESLRMADLRNEIGDTSNDEYLAFLNNRILGLEKFSTEWAETWRLIQTIEEEASEKSKSSRLSDVSGEGFLSQSQLVGFYEKKARDAIEWYNIVKNLQIEGVSGVLIQDLLSAGPSSLPLARAVEALYKSGNLGALTGALSAVESINTAVEGLQGDVGAALPSVEGGSIGTVTITGDLYFTGPDTVKDFVHELEFQLGAAQ